MICKNIDSSYFKDWRKLIGFNNQNEAKKFFKGTDIKAGIDYNYIECLNKRLYEIINKINNSRISKKIYQNLRNHILTSLIKSLKIMVFCLN